MNLVVIYSTGILSLKNGTIIKEYFEINFSTIFPDGIEYPHDNMSIMSPRYKNGEYHYLDKTTKKEKIIERLKWNHSKS